MQEDDAVTLSKIQKDELVKNGFCILPTVLNQERLIEARNALQGAIKKTMDRGLATHIPGLDPNEHNIRIFNLLDLDPLFVDLIADAEALSIVKDLIGNDFIVSNFTANIAKPGSGSMEIHSDLSLVHPPPWDQPWAINIIWVLNDMREENGATRYLPFSHKINQPAVCPRRSARRCVLLKQKQEASSQWTVVFGIPPAQTSHKMKNEVYFLAITPAPSLGLNGISLLDYRTRLNLRFRTV